MSDLPLGRRIILILTITIVLGMVGFTSLLYLFDENVPTLNKGANALSTIIALSAGFLGGMQILIDLLRPKVKLTDEEIENAFAEMAAAKTHLDHRQFDRAVEKATNVIKLLPKKAEAYRLRAKAYEGLSKFASALDDYDKAIDLEPGDPYVYCSRASLLKSMGEYDQAISDMLLCTGLAPDLPGSLFQLGEMYFQLAHFDEAANAFAKVKAHPNTSKKEKDLAASFLARLESLEQLQSESPDSLGET